MTMQITDATSIAQRWIEFFSVPAKQRREEIARDDSWWVLPQDEPELCYAAILQVIELLPSDPSNRVLQAIAAGPTEDLLAKHGATFITRIEAEARRNPPFNLLLGGVWRSSMTQDVWERVQASRLSAW